MAFSLPFIKNAFEFGDQRIFVPDGRDRINVSEAFSVGKDRKAGSQVPAALIV